MKTVWFTGMNDEEKEKFKTLIKNSTHLVERIKIVLESRKLALENEELDMSNNDNILKVACMNARRKELRDIISLFDLSEPPNKRKP